MLKLHLIIYIVSLGILIFIYSLMYKGVQPGDRTPDITANVTQNAISSGLTAVSIVLPITVFILGYMMKEKIARRDILFSACIFFFVSIFAALWNLFRLPSLVTTLNIANDFKTAVFQVVQFYSFVFGLIYLLVGAWKIIKR